jgi:hypothetical protein
MVIPPCDGLRGRSLKRFPNVAQAMLEHGGFAIDKRIRNWYNTRNFLSD